MEAFVKPCVEELKRLTNNGIMHNGIKYAFKPTIFSTNTTARPLLRNTTQFDGQYGCDFAFIRVIFLLIYLIFYLNFDIIYI